MGTYATKCSDIRRQWYLVDADGQVLGRLASEVASILRGKWKPEFCPYLDVGDHVVIVNAEKIHTTGKKLRQKTYFRHSGYLGGDRHTLLRDRLKREPAEVIRDAVRGMLPHNRLGRQMIRKLRIYRDAEHLHDAQRPIPLRLGLHGKGLPGQKPDGVPGSEEA
ncbi:MAG: 50S ribosomal protein L13 [Candidatus Eisenbacteria sp.]|nr:50S ribosomal protein L13 [Candidatus Eisenbacteria bacterium]